MLRTGLRLQDRAPGHGEDEAERQAAPPCNPVTQPVLGGACSLPIHPRGAGRHRWTADTPGRSDRADQAWSEDRDPRPPSQVLAHLRHSCPTCRYVVRLAPLWERGHPSEDQERPRLAGARPCGLFGRAG
jgi:hypothetical protein